jgi:adenylate cyclase
MLILPWFFGFLGLFITQSHEMGVEKRKVRNAFEHYVSKEVISQIMKGSQQLTAGGEKKSIACCLWMSVVLQPFARTDPNEITTFMYNYFIATE